MRLASETLLKYWQSFIDTTVYIYIPESEPDSYWGTIDSRPALIREVALTGIRILKTEVYLLSGSEEYPMNCFEAYTTKQEAEVRLKKKLNWYRVHYERKDGTSQGTYCVRAKSRKEVLESQLDGAFTSVEVELLPDGKMTLEECPIGLFRYDGVLVLKTEYVDGMGRCECYTVDGGERFWGDGSFNLNQLIVQPVRSHHV